MTSLFFTTAFNFHFPFLLPEHILLCDFLLCCCCCCFTFFSLFLTCSLSNAEKDEEFVFFYHLFCVCFDWIGFRFGLHCFAFVFSASFDSMCCLILLTLIFFSIRFLECIHVQYAQHKDRCCFIFITMYLMEASQYSNGTARIKHNTRCVRFVFLSIWSDYAEWMPFNQTIHGNRIEWTHLLRAGLRREFSSDSENHFRPYLKIVTNTTLSKLSRRIKTSHTLNIHYTNIYKFNFNITCNH